MPQLFLNLFLKLDLNIHQDYVLAYMVVKRIIQSYLCFFMKGFLRERAQPPLRPFQRISKTCEKGLHYIARFTGSERYS